jgi:hypothetical protein
MAPVVHGLEKDARYAGRIDFLYLNVADARTAEQKRRLGFTSTPHFFFLQPNGEKVREIQGVVAGDSVRAALDALLVEGGAGGR